MFDKNSKIVVFGGGTGLSNILRGLKKYPLDVTAIVTVSDDGGSSGKLREMFSMTPPGDIRRVLLSLSPNEDLFNDLFNYRFDVLELKDHTVGNIILAALSELNEGNMSKAILKLAEMLNVKDLVLPVSNIPVILEAEFVDGTKACGEQNITCQNKDIKTIYCKGKYEINEDVITAIKEADAIIYSQGSLYTSLIPNLFFKEVKKALKESMAPKIYVANIMTQKGETMKYRLSDHIKAIVDIIGEECLDVVIANDCMNVEEEILKRYETEGSSLVEIDIDNIKKYNVLLQTSRLIDIEDGFIRHNNKKVAAYIFKILLDMME